MAGRDIDAIVRELRKDINEKVRTNSIQYHSIKLADTMAAHQ